MFKDVNKWMMQCPSVRAWNMPEPDRRIRQPPYAERPTQPINRKAQAIVSLGVWAKADGVASPKLTLSNKRICVAITCTMKLKIMGCPFNTGQFTESYRPLSNIGVTALNLSPLKTKPFIVIKTE